jgi:hypothetical protein
MFVFTASVSWGAAGSWEYSPYRIHVWIALAPQPELNHLVRAEIAATVLRRAGVEFRTTWEILLTEPPASLVGELMSDLPRLSAARIAQVAENQLVDDKLICVSVDANRQRSIVRARELDSHTRLWGPLVEKSTRNPEQLADTVFACLVEAFAPITRIELGETRTAVVRLRAGGLAPEGQSLIRPGRGDVLVPVIRNNDRYGKPILERTAEVPWTLLQVTGEDDINRNLLNCNVYSGMRAPIRGRTSGRKERYAVGVRRTHPATDMQVHIRTLKTTDPRVPLPGLEVYSRIPVAEPPRELTVEETKAEERTNPPEFLGYTDWSGTLRVLPAQAPLRLIYIKNGGQLLARLPTVPGYHATQLAEVPDDNPRLQAEGYVKGLNSQIMDLVAQRQILAARIRKRIAENKLEEADQLLAEFRSLPTPSDLQRDLETQMRRQVASPHPAVQTRIDKLYGETRALLPKYLDPDLSNKLMEEVRQARGRATAPTAPTAKSQARAPRPATRELQAAA